MPSLTNYNPASHLVWGVGYLMFGLLLLFAAFEVFDYVRERYGRREWGDYEEELEAARDEASLARRWRMPRFSAPRSTLRRLFFRPIQPHKPTLLGTQFPRLERGIDKPRVRDGELWQPTAEPEDSSGDSKE